MLEILAAVQPCSEKAFSQLEHLVLTHVKSVSGCICVLLSWDAPRQKFIEKLQGLGIPVLVMIVTGVGEKTKITAGQVGGACDQFLVLEAGNIQKDLAKLK